MPDAAFHDQSLGTLFRLSAKPVFPALEPRAEFHHHSLPAWDSTGKPAIEPGSSIESNKVLLDEPAVLVSKLNPRKPRVAVVVPRAGERHCASTEFMCFVPRNLNEDLSYWAYYLGSSSFCARLQRVAIGSTNSHTRASPSEVIRWTVPNPPNAQKRVIAQVLGTLDTTIRQTEAIIEKLKQVKQGLLHDLLTRGIDANGELRPPQSQAPHLYKGSPLGWIPREWDAVPVSDLAENLDGRRLPIKETDRRPGVFPYYGASGIIDWVESYILDGDYVLLGEDGENVVSRHLPLAFRVTGKIWVNNHAHIYEPRQDVDVRFLVEVLEAKDYGPWVSGSAQPKLTQDALARIRFQRPPQHEQVMIADRLEAVASRIASENSEVMKMRTMKSGLMDDLLTGRVRVTPLLASTTI